MKTKNLKIYIPLLITLIVLSACTSEESEPEQNLVFEIGQEYQGGIIFYLDDTSQHGLIAYTADIGRGEWGCFYNDGSDPDFEPPTEPIAQNNGIGFGFQNTMAILNFCNDNDIAARLAFNLNSNGFDDWYLPSIDELALVYEHRVLIGGFPNFSNDEDYFIYASSSEGITTGDGNGGVYYLNYFVYDFADNTLILDVRDPLTSKGNSGRVRPIRSF